MSDTRDDWAKYVDKIIGDSEESRKVILEAERRGFERGVSEVEELIQKWQAAYPEDIFTPLPAYGTKEYEERSEADSVLVTRASAHMGRHMSRCLIEQIRELLTVSDGGEK